MSKLSVHRTFIRITKIEQNSDDISKIKDNVNDIIRKEHVINMRLPYTQKIKAPKEKNYSKGNNPRERRRMV